MTTKNKKWKKKPNGFPKQVALLRTYRVRKLGVGGAIYVPKSLIGLKLVLREKKRK
jgi:putative transposon-encoded protein